MAVSKIQKEWEIVDFDSSKIKDAILLQQNP